MDNDIPPYLMDVWQDGLLDIEQEGRIRPETMRRLHWLIAEQRRSERAAPVECGEVAWREVFGTQAAA